MSGSNIDISVIVPCHAESILLHKTLLSIRRSAEKLPDSISIEIIIHTDTPTPPMSAYVSRIASTFDNVTVYENQFGDPGESRDFCIKKASGRYIALIDGDDLMSENWLKKAYKNLESKKYGDYIAHSEITIEFGTFDGIVQKYEHTDRATDSLLNVWSARWNSIIFAPSTVLKKLGYPKNAPGYGYEDWLISCSFIDEGIKNILIPETVMFVRRKESDSVWDSMRADSLVLPAHPLLSFQNIRTLALPDTFRSSELLPRKITERNIKKIGKSLFIGSPVESLARAAYSKLRNTRQSQPVTPEALPSWLLQEWRSIHDIERLIYPTEDVLTRTSIYHSITELHYRIGAAYHEAIKHTSHNTYDYILFVPWLVSGGADIFAINYANSIAHYNTNKRVLVVATMQYGAKSVWRGKLDSSVDFMPLNDIFDHYDLQPDHQNRILEQIIENSHATHLHILNSIAGYDFLRRHKKYIAATEKKVVVTSFSESSDDSGRIFGFSHTHVPYVYDQASIITTDNLAVQNMWVDLYGFDSKKILLHRPMIASPKIIRSSDTKNGGKKVLWAARLAPEKMPELVASIANLLPGIQIDMYGTPDPNFNTNFLNTLPENVSYKGSYDGYFSLPLGDYSAYLYTSLFDGMPNAIIEAAAAKLPIVASSVGGIPAFVLDQETGLLVRNVDDAAEYAHALKSIIENPDLAKRFVDNAHASLADGYSEASHTKAISEMLKRLDY